MHLRTINTDRVTIHGRVALSLLTAEYVLPYFLKQQQTHNLLQEVLQAGWSWIERREPNPSSLYWDFMPKLMEDELNYHQDEQLLAAFHCFLYMCYYLVWKAEGVAFIEQPDITHSVGSDIADVDDSYLTSCMEKAMEAAPDREKAIQWLNSIITVIERDCLVQNHGEIGTLVQRQAFTIPRLIEGWDTLDNPDKRSSTP